MSIISQVESKEARTPRGYVFKNATGEGVKERNWLFSIQRVKWVKAFCASGHCSYTVYPGTYLLFSFSKKDDKYGIYALRVERVRLKSDGTVQPLETIIEETLPAELWVKMASREDAPEPLKDFIHGGAWPPGDKKYSYADTELMLSDVKSYIIGFIAGVFGPE
jgi:hypothetical protein